MTAGGALAELPLLPVVTDGVEGTAPTALMHRPAGCRLNASPALSCRVRAARDALTLVEARFWAPVQYHSKKLIVVPRCEAGQSTEHTENAIKD